MFIKGTSRESMCKYSLSFMHLRERERERSNVSPATDCVLLSHAAVTYAVNNLITS